jgi:hypothetical protein
MVDSDDFVTIDSVANKGHGTQFLFSERLFITSVGFSSETSKDMTFKLRNEVLN